MTIDVVWDSKGNGSRGVAHMHFVWGREKERWRTVNKATRLYCSTGEQKFTSGSFKPLFGLISSNWLKSFVIVCTCLYVEQLPKPRPWLDISSEAKREEQHDNNWVFWWLDEPKWATREWCLRLNWTCMLRIRGKSERNTWRRWC